MKYIFIFLLFIFISPFVQAEFSIPETMRFVDSKEEPRMMIEVTVGEDQKELDIKTYTIWANGIRLDNHQEAIWYNKFVGFFFKEERIYEVPYSGSCVKIDYNRNILMKFSCNVQKNIWTYQLIDDEEHAFLTEELGFQNPGQTL